MLLFLFTVASTFFHIFPQQRAPGFLIWCVFVCENNILPVWETCKQACITAPLCLSVLGLNDSGFSQEFAARGMRLTDTKKKKSSTTASTCQIQLVAGREPKAHDESCRISHSGSRHTWAVFGFLTPPASRERSQPHSKL